MPLLRTLQNLVSRHRNPERGRDGRQEQAVAQFPGAVARENNYVTQEFMRQSQNSSAGGGTPSVNSRAGHRRRPRNRGMAGARSEENLLDTTSSALTERDQSLVSDFAQMNFGNRSRSEENLLDGRHRGRLVGTESSGADLVPMSFGPSRRNRGGDRPARNEQRADVVPALPPRNRQRTEPGRNALPLPPRESVRPRR